MNEKELQREIERLTKANQALEDFVHVVAHDLQSPLNKIVSFGDLLRLELGSNINEKAADYMDRMRSSAVRMRDLIAAVLDYARMGVEVDAIQNTDMNEVFRDVVEDLEEKIKRSEATVTAAPLPKVYANPTQIRRVLQNLINNGIKFQATDKPSINVSAEAKEGEYIFSVQDNGIGISPQYADQIFQAFRRLHSTAQYPGNGIGLATCRKIIEGHGGRIWVKSEEGKGAVFHFTIPKPPS